MAKEYDEIDIFGFSILANAGMRFAIRKNKKAFENMSFQSMMLPKYKLMIGFGKRMSGDNGFNTFKWKKDEGGMYFNLSISKAYEFFKILVELAEKGEDNFVSKPIIDYDDKQVSNNTKHEELSDDVFDDDKPTITDKPKVTNNLLDFSSVVNTLKSLLPNRKKIKTKFGIFSIKPDDKSGNNKSLIINLQLENWKSKEPGRTITIQAKENSNNISATLEPLTAWSIGMQGLKMCEMVTQMDFDIQKNFSESNANGYNKSNSNSNSNSNKSQNNESSNVSDHDIFE